MANGAKGCEVCYDMYLFCMIACVTISNIVHHAPGIISGKLAAQRGKSLKLKDGYIISSGQQSNSIYGFSS